MDKSNEVRLEQFWNMAPILVTDEVLKLDKSNEVRLEQLRNMTLISVTFEVSQPDTSNEVRLEQFRNMALISVILEVLTKFKPLISVRFLPVVIPHELIFIGL